jgi:hypothetical protein
MLGISRDTIYRMLNKGATISKPDVVQKINENYKLARDNPDARIASAWARNSQKYQVGTKKADVDQGVKIIKARTNNSRAVLTKSAVAKRPNVVRNAIKPTGREGWNKKLSAAQRNYRNRVKQAQRDGKAMPQGAFGSP